jgi:fused signal recognition particle receptor
MLEVHEAPGREPAARFEQGRGRAERGSRERRIQEHEVHRLGRMRQEARGVAMLQARAAGLGAPLVQQLAQGVDGASVAVDERAARGAARERLEPERARTGIEVEATPAFEPALQPVEQGLAHAIAGRTYLARPKLPATSAPAAGDDAQAPGLRAARVIALDRRGGCSAAGFGSHGSEAYRMCENLPMPEAPPNDAATAEPGRGFFGRLHAQLSRSSENLARQLRSLVQGRKIDAALLEELEERLIGADLGVTVTSEILEELRSRAARHELADGDAMLAALRAQLAAILRPCEVPLRVNRNVRPYVVLVVGVNGSGKTTTIGKLAGEFGAQGLKVMLAAGDTFRAAAIEQLGVWAERSGAQFIAQQAGTDPGAVVFDAMQAARARGCDVLIADTAGRLHNQAQLMDELRKIKRVMGRADPTAPHEVLLVLDANQGQNALAQAEQFHAAIGVTGLVVTKLDGTARGGIVVAIARRLGLPIRLLGVGEQGSDFGQFDAAAYAQALVDGSEGTRGEAA